MRRILIIGSRGYDAYKIMESVLDDYIEDNGWKYSDVEIVESGATGIEYYAKNYAISKGAKHKRFNADWSKGANAVITRGMNMVKYVSQQERKVCFIFCNEDTECEFIKSLVKDAGIKMITVNAVEKKQLSYKVPDKIMNAFNLLKGFEAGYTSNDTSELFLKMDGVVYRLKIKEIGNGDILDHFNH